MPDNTRLVELESDYEYVIGSVMGNVLNLQAEFSRMDWSKSDLELISKELVNTAKLFAAQQGLGGVSVVHDVSVNGNFVQIVRQGGTGTLINSIHADIVGSTINFYNNANLGRGYYAGHIEYGFHDRAGNPVAARPFMRPAFHAVARASQGQISGTLKRFLEGYLLSRSYATFGTPRTTTGALRAFYNQPRGPIRGAKSGTYTTQGLRNTRLNAQSRWGAVNKSNRILGTVRDNERVGFIGKGNDRRVLSGNTRTASTIKDGSQKHGTNPLKYSSYGNWNRNIPGRRSSINYNPKETQRRLAGRRTSFSKRSFETTKISAGHRWQTTTGQQAKRRAKAEEMQWKIDKTFNVKKVPVYKSKTSYSKKTYKVSRISTKKRK